MKPLPILLLLLGLFAVLGLVLWPGLSPEQARETIEEESSATAPRPDSADWNGQEPETRRRESTPTESGPGPSVSTITPADILTKEARMRGIEPERPTGEIRLEIVDWSDGQPLSELTVRFLSSDRIAVVEDGSPIEGKLSEGEYEGLVLKAGFDPLALEPFRVVAGQSHDLGQVALKPGTAIVEGIVRAPLAVGGEVLSITLQGRDAPPRTVEVARYESFRFESLGAGDYHLNVSSEDGVTMFAESLQLEVGERRWLDLDLEFIDLKLTVIDAEERPFDGNWNEVGKLYADRMRFFFFADSINIGLAEIAPMDPSWPSRFETSPESEALRTELLRNSEAGDENQDTPIPDRVDQRRNPNQSLWPAPIKPSLSTKPLPIQRMGTGQYRIRNVPLSAEHLLLSCGPYFSLANELSLADWDGKPIVVQLMQRCGMSSEMLEELKDISCNSCHALPFEVPQ